MNSAVSKINVLAEISAWKLLRDYERREFMAQPVPVGLNNL